MTKKIYTEADIYDGMLIQIPKENSPWASDAAGKIVTLTKVLNSPWINYLTSSVHLDVVLERLNNGQGNVLPEAYQPWRKRKPSPEPYQKLKKTLSYDRIERNNKAIQQELGKMLSPASTQAQEEQFNTHWAQIRDSGPELKAAPVIPLNSPANDNWSEGYEAWVESIDFQPEMASKVVGAQADKLNLNWSRLPLHAMGLAEEAGEVAGKVKKLFRDHAGDLSTERREQILSEISDVLWYTAALTNALGSSLKELSEINIKKLESRKARGTLGGSGDDR